VLRYTKIEILAKGPDENGSASDKRKKKSKVRRRVRA
jgi:hypothetical protein